MIAMYAYYARCNRAVNTSMVRILGDSDRDLFNLETDGYFRSIGEILNHCYIGDLSWMNSYRTVRAFSVLDGPVFQNMPRFGDQPFSSLGEFREARAALDGLISELTGEIVPDDLRKIGSRVNRLGQRKEYVFWKALIHMFNHQTHHRGQVSQILDGLGIENDYSNMILIDPATGDQI